jgi:uncharacterized protein (TIRG00374 family)
MDPSPSAGAGTDAVAGTALADGAAPDTEGAGDASSPPPRLAGAGSRRWQAIVLASSGDGQTRRRASDAVRVAGDLLLFLVCVVVIHFNPQVEVRLANLLNSAPSGVHWLITAAWLFGSVAVMAVVVVWGILTRRLPLLRDVIVSGIVAWLACVAAGAVLGSTGGRPPTSGLGTIDPGFPSVRIAVTIAVTMTALPYLSRALRRLTITLVWLALLAGLVVGACMPLVALASVAIGMAVAAAVHLAFGSPLGLPSVASVADALVDLGVGAMTVRAVPGQVWGVARYVADPSGPGGGAGAPGPARPAQRRSLEVAVYGRDASDAQALAKAWRFLAYRDSGPTLLLTRLQQVEHEAYLTLRAGQVGVTIPEVVAAGYGGPSRDALLVTAPPAGTRLAALDAASVPDGAMAGLFGALARLREVKLAHGAVSPETVVVGRRGEAALRDFRCASTDAPVERCDRDMAGALATCALVAGVERTAAVAARGVPDDVLVAALPHLQPRALDPVTQKALEGHKSLLAELRTALAGAAGIDVPELTELRRFSWGTVLMAVGSVIGLWAIVGVLVNVAGSFDTLKGAAWGWVAAVFVISLLPPVVEAWGLVGSVFAGVPARPVIALEFANTFTGLVGGTPATLAMTVRFFQRRGATATYAVTAGALNSATSWIVKGALFLISIPLVIGSFDPSQSTSGSHSGLVHALLLIIILVGVLAGVAVAVLTFARRARRAMANKIRPLATKAFEPVRNLAREPRKFAFLIGGNLGSQLLTAMALGASLHAFGQHLSLAAIFFTITIASMLGGVSPVPGGMGIVEAGLIAGLMGFGIPEDVAVAAVFVQRLFTAYLPPIWGYATLIWLRRREFL